MKKGLGKKPINIAEQDSFTISQNQNQRPPFQSKTTRKWLINRLLDKKETHHNDAINAGYGHRLALTAHYLRHERGWRTYLKTNKDNYYYIPKYHMMEAKKLARIQDLIPRHPSINNGDL